MDAYNVCVVEDDQEIRDGIGIYLVSQGYHVLKAANGQEGLDIISKEEIHLAIVDVMMPVMDGCDAARAIRALDRPDAKTVPIFAMTANAFAEDRQKALAAGMTDHLTKPLDRIVMLQALANVCTARGQNSR